MNSSSLSIFIINFCKLFFSAATHKGVTFNLDIVKHSLALKGVSAGESVFLEYLVLFSELHDCVTSAAHLLRDQLRRYNCGRWLMTHLTTPNAGLLSEK